MNESNQPTGQQLTPENLLRIALCGGHLNPAVSKLVTQAMKDYAAQQTAALREEVARLKGSLEDAEMCKKVANTALTDEQKKNSALREELERSKERIDYYREAADKKDVTIQEMDSELEAVKKERDSMSKTVDVYLEAITIINSDKDKAVKLAQRIYDKALERRMEAKIANKFEQELSRLSSGETKPASTNPDEYPGKSYQPLFDYMSKEHNLTLLESEMQDIIEIVRGMDSPWISVESTLPQEGRYLFIYDKYEGRDIGYYKEGVWFEKDSGREKKYVTHYCEFPTSPESQNK